MMRRNLHWIPFLLAIAGPLAHGFSLSLSFLASASSLLGSLAFLLLRPRDSLFLLLLLPAGALALLSGLSPPLFEKNLSSAWSFLGSALALFLGARVLFLGLAHQAAARNKEFASDLKAALPERSTVFVDLDIESETSSSSIQEGHLIRMRPGDSLPADGIVTFGSSFVDERLLSGDPDPKAISMGAQVFAGSVNKNGSFIFRASASPSRSMLWRIASALEAPVASASYLGGRFFFLETLALSCAFAAFFFLSPLAGLNVLLASCGTFFAAGLWLQELSFRARSAAEGIEWKEQGSAGKLARVGTVVSSAKGALTEGKLKVTDIKGTEGLSEDGALRLVGPLARRLENAYAFALLQEMQSRNIRLEIVESYGEDESGPYGLVAGEEVRWLRLEAARKEGIALGDLASFAEEKLFQGEAVQVLSRNGKAAAAFSFRDSTSPHAKAGLKALDAMGIPFVLVATSTQLGLRQLQQELQVFHAHPDCDDEEKDRLLARLAADGLAPLWVAHPAWKAHNPAGPVAVPSLAGFSADGDVRLLRRDLAALSRMLQLARRHAREERFFFFLALASQLALAALSAFFAWNPLLAATVGLGPALALFGLARKPLFLRL